TIRILPHALIFAVIIIYTVIGNYRLINYSHDLAETADHNYYSNSAGHAGGEKQMAHRESIRNVTDLSEEFRLFVAVMFIVITVLLASEFLLAGRGINAMDEVARFARRVANGDFTMDDLHIRNHSQLEKLAQALNEMKHRLNAVVCNVSSTVNELSTISDGLRASSQIITEDTQKQIVNTGQVAGAVEMMSVVVYDVTKNSSVAATSAKEASELARRGGDVVAETISGMNKISRSVNTSAHTISVLGKKSEQIGEIVKVINDIANQTNLLALNAAIEAARAGEQGRGFAVVADEVRKLAERTTTATSEIGDMIASIQDETRNAVESMQSATKEVEEGTALANQADDSLKQIVESVQNVMDMVQQIAASARLQSDTGETVSTSLQSIADENRKTAEIAEEYFGTTEELSRMSSELRSLIAGLRSGNGSGQAASYPEGTWTSS
ncbi:MAG: methyl-accepting chemotaxis protein, partial [Nitrospiraceae bacterium]